MVRRRNAPVLLVVRISRKNMTLSKHNNYLVVVFLCALPFPKGVYLCGIFWFWGGGEKLPTQATIRFVEGELQGDNLRWA